MHSIRVIELEAWQVIVLGIVNLRRTVLLRLTLIPDDLALLKATDVCSTILILRPCAHLLDCVAFNWYNLLINILCLQKVFVEEWRGTILILKRVIRLIIWRVLSAILHLLWLVLWCLIVETGLDLSWHSYKVRKEMIRNSKLW